MKVISVPDPTVKSAIIFCVVVLNAIITLVFVFGAMGPIGLAARAYLVLLAASIPVAPKSWRRDWKSWAEREVEQAKEMLKRNRLRSK
jgi:hypothetical protein